MARTTWHMGLNEWARRFVAGNEVLLYTESITRQYPDGRIVYLGPTCVLERNVIKETLGEHYSGMYEEEFPLHRYVFKNGRVVYERVQASPWLSGPNVYLALQDEQGKWIAESLWDWKEIDVTPPDDFGESVLINLVG